MYRISQDGAFVPFLVSSLLYVFFPGNPANPGILSEKRDIYTTNFRKFRGKDMMEYKGYVGMVEYDSEAKLFHGGILNTRDVITFQGTSVLEIEEAFKGSIDDYSNWCKSEGVEPEKPYSGKI